MLKIRAKALYIAKIWAKSKIFQLFRNFNKISIYTKNDEMNMFGEFQLKITTGSAKTVTPIFAKIPEKWGFHKNDEFFIFPEFFTKKCLFSQK